MSDLLDKWSGALDKPLAGRVAIVTGGGRGLGEAICTCLAEAGASVVACDIRTETAEAVADAIRAGGGEARGLPLDVTDEHQADAVVQETLEVYEGLDVLINNAGIDATLPFDEMPVETFDRILDVNLRGPVVMARAVFPHMRQQGTGHIVNVASTAAKRTWPNASAYHASKWGLLGFSHALHTEARPLGIKVTAIVAGGMRTPFLFDRFPDLDPGVLQDPASVARSIRFVLTQPDGTVIPEITVLPMGETSWP
jgi:NAD(P)-dependent dehydrogenase (short-subunit alcohol dehydrogenase family)